MNDLMMKWFGASWRSTLGGLLMGVPPLITGSAMAAGLTVGKWVIFGCTFSMGLGALILGTNAKDKQVHSTATEVDKASQPKP